MLEGGEIWLAGNGWFNRHGSILPIYWKIGYISMARYESTRGMCKQWFSSRRD